MKMEQLTSMTPEQIADDEAAIKKIRERNLAEKAAQAAKEKIKEADESHDFSDEVYRDKALQREKQIEALKNEISGM